MVRKFDKEKVQKIRKVLKENPYGTYVSEISRKTKLAKSTVAYIINTRLKNQIIELKVGEKGLFKIIKLKTPKTKTF